MTALLSLVPLDGVLDGVLLLVRDRPSPEALLLFWLLDCLWFGAGFGCEWYGGKTKVDDEVDVGDVDVEVVVVVKVAQCEIISTSLSRELTVWAVVLTTSA